MWMMWSGRRLVTVSGSKNSSVKERRGRQSSISAWQNWRQGRDIPLHRHNLAHRNYILEGEVWARLGRQRFQLEAEASNYFFDRGTACI